MRERASAVLALDSLAYFIFNKKAGIAVTILKILLTQDFSVGSIAAKELTSKF